MKLKSFVFGIRVSRSFYIEDNLGAITDYILYTNGSEFNPKLFPQVKEQAGMKLLFNEKTNNQFALNHSDFIFCYNIDTDFDNEFSKYLSSFSDIITKRLFQKFSIGNIVRFGFVIKAELEQNDSLSADAEVVIKKSYPKYECDSFSLRFNAKESKALKINEQITEDFDNTIVTYDRPDKSKPLMFSVDYQKYFKPELGEISQAPCSFEDFCMKCYEIYKTKYCVK